MSPYFLIMMYKKGAQTVFRNMYVHVQSPLTHSYPLVNTCRYLLSFQLILRDPVSHL